MSSVIIIANIKISSKSEQEVERVVPRAVDHVDEYRRLVKLGYGQRHFARRRSRHVYTKHEPAPTSPCPLKLYGLRVIASDGANARTCRVISEVRLALFVTEYYIS